MRKRSSIKRTDDQLARSIMKRATSESKEFLTAENLTPVQMAARILGQQGGLKGGKARARKLSARKRKEIARKAAAARWKNQSH